MTHRQSGLVAAFLLLAGCGAPANDNRAESGIADDDNASAAAVQPPEPSGAPAPAVPEGPKARWENGGDDKVATLSLLGADGRMTMRVQCEAGPARLTVSVPSFTPIGSEDRFAFGVGSEPVTLVADPTRQQAGGVTAEGSIPEGFAELLNRARTMSALYGTQRIGPEPIPAGQIATFARGCVGR